MKQRRIKELSINHYEQGSSVHYTPSRTEEYAPVLAQAEAHQDLRFHAEINSVETLIILPWESVIGVYATYETVDVAAPTDTICGGEAANPLVLTLINPSESCYVLDNDAIYSFVSTYDDDFHATQSIENELNRAFVTQILFNGEDITEDESVEGTYELTLVNGVATLKITVSYEGHTATQSLTATDVCD